MRSLPSSFCRGIEACECAVGVSRTGPGASALFVDGAGGDRVGYLRVVFGAVEDATLLAVCAALEDEFPIMIEKKNKARGVGGNDCG